MLILNLQFFPGDRHQAMELARLIADLEDQPRYDVLFLFSARFDCVADPVTVAYVSKKFPTFTHKSRKKGVGWPAGPNQLMADSYQWCVEKMRDKTFKAQAVLFIESDAVPLHKNWINLLIEEYKACGKMIMGSWLVAGNGGGVHVNGNCIMHLDFWKVNKAIFNPPNRGGWDAILAPSILPNAHPSRLMFSDYHLGTPSNPWRGCDYLWEPKIHPHPSNPLYNQHLQPVWLHGPKITIGQDCVRKRLLNHA